MVNAFRAGTAVAVVAAVVGWFMVLRAADVRGSHAVGRRVSRARRARCGSARARASASSRSASRPRSLIAALPRAPGRGFSEESAVIGTLQAFALACGLLFVSLYAGFLNGVTSLLFGNFLGITDAQVVTLAVDRVGLRRRDRGRVPAAAVRFGRSRRRVGARAYRPGVSRCCSSSCSASRWRKPRRSPARCSCSRCSWSRRRPRRR